MNYSKLEVKDIAYFHKISWYKQSWYECIAYTPTKIIRKFPTNLSVIYTLYTYVILSRVYWIAWVARSFACLFAYLSVDINCFDASSSLIRFIWLMLVTEHFVVHLAFHPYSPTIKQTILTISITFSISKFMSNYYEYWKEFSFDRSLCASVKLRLIDLVMLHQLFTTDEHTHNMSQWINASFFHLDIEF